MCVVNTDGFELNSHDLLPIVKWYTRGDTGPHYSVPAIPMEIEWSISGWPRLVEYYEHGEDVSSVYIHRIGNHRDLEDW